MTSLDRQGQFWDKVTEQAQPMTEALRLIESLLPTEAIRSRDVLDVGCGAGDYSAAFTQAGAHSVTGFDISMGSLRIAHKKTPSGRFMQVNISELPYPSNTFDILWSWGVLHYVPDSQRALSEIARVLRPGGTAVIHTLETSLWALLESTSGKVLSHAPRWVESTIMATGERVIPLISRVITGHYPEEQTSKSIRQKLHEQFFAPNIHSYTFEQLKTGLGPTLDVQKAYPPITNLSKLNTSITVVARKHG